MREKANAEEDRVTHSLDATYFISAKKQEV